MDPEPSQPSYIWALAILPALLAALFAVVSATMSNLSKARRIALRDHFNDVQAAAFTRYIDAKERIESRWLVGRVMGVATSAVLLSAWVFPKNALGLTSTVATAVLCYALPAEVLKGFFLTRAEEYGPALLRGIRPLELLVAPIADPLSVLGGGIYRKPDGREASNSLLESEVEQIVNVGEMQGAFDQQQSEMLRNVLEFDEVKAEEVMVPRIQVDALDVSLTLERVLTLITESQHSRYPVYADRIDNLVGILHVKDLFYLLSKQDLKKTTLEGIIRKPIAFISEAQLASTVLKDMRAGRHHMAAVLNEFGGFSGIITLEDLLEEIVGDIRDEHDVEEKSPLKFEDDGGVLVDASIAIHELNRLLGSNLSEGNYVSIGGLLLERLGLVPEEGSCHVVDGLRITVIKADERHIAVVKVWEELPA